MDNFDIINKAFRTILPILANYIGITLKEKDEKNWWKKYVLNSLNESTIRNLPKNGTYDDYINSLDIQACLNVIIKNWNEVFSNKLKNKFLTYAHEIKNIRNEIDAHYTMELIKTLNEKDVKRALDTIIIFIEPLDKTMSENILMIKNSLSKDNNDNNIKSSDNSEIIIEISIKNKKEKIKNLNELENVNWNTVHIFSKDGNNEYRYVLGSNGKTPIIFFGINPSKATGFNTSESDPTTDIIKNLSKKLKLDYDSCYLINVYPQRAGKPEYLEKEPNDQSHKENIRFIKHIIKRNSTIFAGWGNLEDKKHRKYIIQYLIEIYNEIKDLNIIWYCLPNKLQNIHPPHPARKTITKLEIFKMDEYIKMLEEL